MRSTLVCAQELHEHLHDPDWVVVDCRHLLADFSAGRKLYEAGHIPGAYFADVENDLAGERTGSNGRHPLPEWAQFAQWLASMGIGDGTQVVAYDAGGDMFAARLWFLLQFTGHEAAAVLDGGFAEWTAAGYDVDANVPERKSSSPKRIHLQTHLAVSAHDVLRALDSGEFTLMDARGADRFMGQNEVIDPVAGHIPGAVNRPFKSNFDSSGRFKKPEELRSEFEQHGVPPEKVVHQCGSGVSAAVNMLAMRVAGLPMRPVYAGSWSEWCSDPSRPMETFG